MKIKMEGTLVPLKIQHCVWVLVACGLVFIAGVTFGTRIAPEDPKQVLEFYNHLHQLSRSIRDLETDIWAAKKDLAELPGSFMAGRKQELEVELRALSDTYESTAKEYNTAMVVSRHRFADSDRLPDGAKFGALPMQYPTNAPE